MLAGSSYAGLGRLKSELSKNGNNWDMTDQRKSNLDEAIRYLNMQVKESDLPINVDGYSNYNRRHHENMYHTQCSESTIKEHGINQTSSGMYPVILAYVATASTMT